MPEKDKDPAPTKVKAKPKPKEEKGVLEAAAEVIGSTLGTIAKTTGIAKAPKKKTGKLQKKNKQRMPRKAKKKAAKALGSATRK